MGIGNSFIDVAVKSSSEVSAEVWSRQISISRPSLGEHSLFSLKLDDDADSSNLLIPQVFVHGGNWKACTRFEHGL